MTQTAYMSPKDEFGRWLLDNMIERKWTCTDVAKRLRITRQVVNYHVTGRTSPNYAWVIAYCWIFDDDPDEIWKLVGKKL